MDSGLIEWRLPAKWEGKGKKRQEVRVHVAVRFCVTFEPNHFEFSSSLSLLRRLSNLLFSALYLFPFFSTSLPVALSLLDIHHTTIRGKNSIVYDIYSKSRHLVAYRPFVLLLIVQHFCQEYIVPYDVWGGSDHPYDPAT